MSRVGRSSTSAPTCRCTSPRSIPTSRCSTCRRTPPATLARARRIALRNGLRYVYTGNVHDAAGGSTYCPGCGARVIERDWYGSAPGTSPTTAAARRAARRARAGSTGRPGTWGARRLPVRLADFEATRLMRESVAPAVAGLFYPADAERLAASVAGVARRARCPTASPVAEGDHRPARGLRVLGPDGRRRVCAAPPAARPGRAGRAARSGAPRAGSQGLAVERRGRLRHAARRRARRRRGARRVARASRRCRSTIARTRPSTASRCSCRSCSETLGAFTLLPLVVGDARPADVAAVLERCGAAPRRWSW